jgi:ABC-type transport system involved in multi-copper enzyme maturation permease subunit
MTAIHTSSPDTDLLDISATAPVPLSRLLEVELRKLVDTRAGRWLLILQAGLVLLGSVGVLIAVAVQDESIAFMDFTSIAGFVMSVLLPVMGILAVTSEWTQRTNMTTFSLEPRRGRILLAKAGAVLVAGTASILIAVAVGVVTSAVASLIGVDVDWAIDLDLLGGFAFAQALGVLSGFALGALFLNTPAAIVAFFASFTVLPGLLALGADSLSWFADIRPWIDFADAQIPLTEDGFSDAPWPELLVSGLLWLALPLAAGARRILRSEVK